MDADFLVVGAGSAGCTVARVLGQEYRVLLCECGTNRWASPQVARPADYLKRFGSSDDWGYATVAQSHLNQRKLAFPRGKGAGGSTRINASIWLPPSQQDLTSVAESSEHLISLERLTESLRLVTQWVRPESQRWLSAATRAFLASANDFLDDAQPFLRMNHRGRRRTAFDLLEDAESGHRVMHRVAEVHRLLIEKGECIGAELQIEENLTSVRPRYGTIVCAGTIGSPKLLFQSGIGPADNCTKQNIDCEIDVPCLGQNLSDHLVFPIVMRQRPSGPSHTSTKFPDRWSTTELARWQCNGSGPCASNLAEAGGFLNVGDISAQIFVTPTDYLRHPGAKSQSALTIGVVPCHPKSKGELHFVKNDAAKPYDISVAIDPAYLSHASDEVAMTSCVHAAFQLLKSDPIAQLVDSPICPRLQDGELTESMVMRAARRFAQSLYHPVGTCAMGTVVDGACRLSGIDRLWVVDASVLPRLPSGNPNALIMTLSHVIAERIKEQVA